jgi:hypothetical protein
MAKHFISLEKIKNRINSSGLFNYKDFDMNNTDKEIVMDLIVHSCDISNPIKKI